jgi:rod shape-determining protein MreD
MRLLPYILLGYVAVGMQVGLSGYVHLGGAAPNIVLIVAIFFALFAQREPALLSCFALGLMQDLLTQQRLGLYALSYGLLALVIVSTAAMVYREHPLTHAAITLAASLLTSLVLLFHGAIFGAGPGIGASMLSAILTALLAPALIRGLMKLRPLLGMRVARRWT